jgi:tetratricopeptide (TPR) repeat protein
MIVALPPSPPAIIAQVADDELFYTYVKQKRYADAIDPGMRYLEAHPENDDFACDLAYALLDLGRTDDARKLLRAHAAYLRAHPDRASVWLDLSYKDADAKRYHDAIDDVDAYLAIKPNDVAAKAQRTAYGQAAWGGPRYTSYGYTQYEGRFSDTLVGIDQTYALAPQSAVQPYVATHLSEDTRSGAPGASQIFNDNALIADAGLRSKFGSYLLGFIEGGVGIGLRGQGTISDLRYGLEYSRQFAAAPLASTTVNVSAVMYSRYAGNGIMYYNVMHDFAGHRLRPVVGINGGIDTHGVFGNNFAEAEGGVDVGTSAFTLRVLGVRGYYFQRGSALTAPPYSTLRVQMIFSAGK